MENYLSIKRHKKIKSFLFFTHINDDKNFIKTSGLIKHNAITKRR